jgi:TonB family protein
MLPMHFGEVSELDLPRFEVRWEHRSQNFFESMRAVLAGPRPARHWPTSPFFRVTWVRPRFPGRGMFASVLWHILLINLSIPLGHLAGEWYRPERKLLPPRIEITWYGPAQDLAPLVAPAPAPRPSPPGKAARPLAPRGAQAYHPRATILSLPVRPSSPRQTLIQPAAPAAPKILPAIPNVVAWNQSPPTRPPLPVPPGALAGLHPDAPRPQAAPAPAPELPDREKRLGPLDIAQSALANQQPQLPLEPSSVPAPQVPAGKPAPIPAPEISAGALAIQMIALSVVPGTAPPPPVNAQATLIASPEGTRPGVPGGALGPASTDMQGGAGSASVAPGATEQMAGTGALGPASLLISGAAGPKGVGSSPGTIARVIPPAFALPLPPKPIPRPSSSPVAPRAASSHSSGGPPPSLIAQQILGPGGIHTMFINMPNLTSASGSWVIDFRELGGKGPGASSLSGPDPIRKVDPKYPPELISEHVEGEVVLYAIIFSDGTVGPIHVVKGLDPTLDHNAAAAFARWVFRPAMRNGRRVDLAAVVHIPFRAAAPP